jgi:HEAT repeat protein
MYVSEADEGVRTVLVRKISYFNNEDATNTLIEALDDASRRVQETAAAGLERTGLRGGEDRVMKKISGEDNWISYFAVRALGKNCSDKVSSYLKKLYPSLNGKVRLAVVEALGSGCGNSEEFLTDRLSEDNEDIRREALAGISCTNGELALEKAVSLVKTDPSWLVRFKAIEVIASEAKPGYKQILEDVKNRDTNRYIQDKVDAVLGN